ncbi:MAG: FKBP-type peptidyl-prolyl cis-trans isomerase [Actinomycetaceae bacterium]|nr:FKBP-type peptidyl-prolyl cis-trans isomerase [Actinomycetaceae bacterium]
MLAKQPLQTRTNVRLYALVAGLALICATLVGCSGKQDEGAPPKDGFPSVQFGYSKTVTIGEGQQAPSQVKVRTLRQAKNASPQTLVQDGDTILADYQGQTWDGTIFETTYQQNWTALPMELDKVKVQGLKEGIIGHHIGDLLQIIVPAHKAYGDNEQRSVTGDVLIEKNTPLVYVVDIIDHVDLRDYSALTKAQPIIDNVIKKRLPKGIHVVSELGKEPVITIDDNVVPPKETQLIHLSQGKGKSIGPDDYVAQHIVMVPLQQGAVDSATQKNDTSKVYSDWDKDTLQLTPDFVGNDLKYLGINVGSRVLVLMPAAQLDRKGRKADTEPVAMIIDYGGTLTVPK